MDYESISMTNVMIDKTKVQYSVPTYDYTFGSYGLEAGLYLGYDLDDNFQIFTSGQLPAFSIFSNNPKYPPQVVSPSGSTSDLNCDYVSFSLGLKVSFDTPSDVDK
jgi:hypothetical protein